MSTFESQIAAAQQRQLARTADRTANEILIRRGETFKADTPACIYRWFHRRGLSSEMAELAIKSGWIPLEAQEAFRPTGRDEPLALERVLGTANSLGVAFLEEGLQVDKYFRDVFEHDWENLPHRDISNSFQRVRPTDESTPADDAWMLLSPKDYLPML